MYEERKEKFSIRDVILQILFIVLFVFILIWLFPTKGYLNERLKDMENKVDSKLDVLYNRVFNDNLNDMKDAAKDYFTTPRLPKNVGDKVSKTLREMQTLNLVLPFKDSNNKQCDLDNSYVEITKMDDEYIMKVNLSCSDNDAYVLVHLGCYGYCGTTLCETPEKPVTKPVENPKPSNPDPKPIVNKKYEWEYVLSEGGKWGDWSDWTNWSTSKPTASDSILVDTPLVKKEITDYEQVWGIVSTTYEPIYGEVERKYNVLESQYLPTGKTQRELAGYVPITVKYEETTTPGKSYWTAKQSLAPVTSKKWSSDTVRYTLASSYLAPECAQPSCKTVTWYIYDVEYYKTSGGTTTKKCPAGSQEVSGQCVVRYDPVYKDVPVYAWQQVSVEKTVKEQGIVDYKRKDKMGYVQGDPIYSKVTYYRYKERTYIPTKVKDRKWSTENDTDLLNRGYVKTGNKQEIK